MASSTPAWMDALGDYIDARVKGLVGQAAASPSASARVLLGTITAASPVRVQLDGDTAPVGYSPPCLYTPALNERVLVLAWGSQIAIVGPASGPAPTPEPSWAACSFYTANGFTQVSGTDKAQEREVGGFVGIRGAFQQTTAGGNFGNGILVGLPQSPVTQMVGWGQWQTGGRAALIIAAGDTEVVADITASSGTFGAGWVRISGGAGYWTTPW